MSFETVTKAMALELLARGLPFQFIARGASMRPFVRDGDVLIVAPEAERAQVGDLVFIPQGSFTIHRVIARIGERVWVKGDALPRADGVFLRSELLGLVVCQSRADRLQKHRILRAIPVSILGGWLRRTQARWR